MYGTAKTAEQLETIVTIPRITVDLWLASGLRSGEHPYWNLATIEEGVRRVNKGARLLDEVEPEWVFSVFPKTLNMQAGELCIIGQVYGDFDENMGIPFGMEVGNFADMEDADMHRASALATEHGFLADDGSMSYGLLDRVWVFMLVERHNRDGEPVFLAMPELN